jgi:hypothetical protein
MPAPTTAKTYDQILSQCLAIKNRIEEGGNTAEIVGTTMKDILDYSAVNGGGSGGGTGPTVAMLTPTTNVDINATIFCRFTTTSSIKFGSTTLTSFTKTDLSSGANALRTLIASNLTGIAGITSFTSANVLSYNASNYTLELDFTPNDTLLNATTYTFVIDGFSNTAGVGTANTFTFLTKGQNATLNLTPSKSTGAKINNIQDFAISKSLNLLFTADANDYNLRPYLDATVAGQGFVGIYDLDDLSNYRSQFIVEASGSSKIYTLCFDDVNKLLCVFRNSQKKIDIYSVSRTNNNPGTAPSWTLLSSNDISSFESAIQNYSSVCVGFSASGAAKLYWSIPNSSSGDAKVVKFDLNVTTGVLSNKTDVLTATISAQSWGLSYDSKRRQVILLINNRRINVSDTTDTLDSAFDTDSFISGKVPFKTSYYDDNQIILNSLDSVYKLNFHDSRSASQNLININSSTSPALDYSQKAIINNGYLYNYSGSATIDKHVITF